MPYTRHRSEGPYESREVLTKYHKADVMQTYEHVSYRYHAEMTDVVTEGYNRIVRNGGIVNNPYSRTVKISTSGQGSYSAVSNTDPTETYHTVGGSITSYQSSYAVGLARASASADVEFAVKAAKQQAMANIDSGEFGFGEDLAEWKETLRFLRSPVDKIARYSRGFSDDAARVRRRLNNLVRTRYLSSRAITSVPPAVMDLYLAYRFAVTPLIRSCEDALEAFSSSAGRPPLRRTARGQSSLQEMDETTPRMYWAPNLYDQYESKDKHIVEARAGILYEYNSSGGWPMKLGLRPQDIPETVWAVVPYSFLVDRFINISDAVRGATNLLLPGLVIKAAWVTVKETRETTLRYLSQTHPQFAVTVNGDEVKEVTTSKYRIVWQPNYQDVLPPGLTPGKAVHDATYIADLLALSANLVRSAFT